MRKNRLLITLAVLLMACDQKDETSGKTFDVDRNVFITGSNYNNEEIDDAAIDHVIKYAIGFVSTQSMDPYRTFRSEDDVVRDSENQRFVFTSKLLLIDGHIQQFLTGDRDIVFEAAVDENGRHFIPLDYDSACKRDTIAYIPNRILDGFRSFFLDALLREDYEGCYQYMDRLLLFVPITGAEWRKLREQGLQ